MEYKPRAAYLADLQKQRNNLAANLTAKGVWSSPTEKFNTLIPKVLQIEGGNGDNGDIVEIGDFRIRYLYRDKITGREKMHTQWLNRGENGIFPTDVGDVVQTANNPALTFQGWNFTGAQLTNVQNDMDVGAVYITADGWSYLYGTVTRVTGLTFPFYFNKSNTATLTIETSWGESFTNTSFGNQNQSITAPDYGRFWIRTKITSGTGTYGFGGGSTGVVIGGATQSLRNILTHCFIGDNVVSMSDYVFYNCYSLTSTTIPNSMANMANSTFQNCYSLTSITIPQGVTNMGVYASQNCASLTFISIPYGVTDISAGAFQNCYSLTSITIPQGVTSINNTTFTSCNSLTNIIIPSSVTSIGNSAFDSCRSIIKYIFMRPTPPAMSNINAFNNINSITKMFVPDESVEAYKTATNWATYANHISPKGEI